MPDRGSMSIVVVLVCVAFASTTALAMVPLLNGLVDRQHAQNAADAAALAGVTGGRSSAERMAVANGGDLTRWSVEYVSNGTRVTVGVQVADQLAIARATDEP